MLALESPIPTIQLDYLSTLSDRSIWTGHAEISCAIAAMVFRFGIKVFRIVLIVL
jgi:hypothetical protein